MSKNAPFQFLEKPVSRRKILTTSINGGLCFAAGSLMLPFKKSFAAKILSGATKTQHEDKVVWSMCSVNCGSRCALRLHIKDNEVYWVETDHTGNDEYNDHQIRACLRGRSIRRRINHPDRLKYPMKRVGKRGEGKFVRISWDEALDTIANNLKRILKQYGNESVHVLYGTGVDGGNMTNSNVPYRLMNACGGFLSRYGSYSSSQITMAMPFTYGTQESNSFADAINSKLIVLFGNNPCETRMSGASITYTYEQVRERSQAKVIVIDPRYTDSAGGREDQWVPIRPGTDAALVAGIAHVLITENLVNQPFLDKYCVGYDEKTLPPEAPKNGHYKAYILGQGEDKTEKTPQWASEITGITPDVIIQLAREIAQAKPAFICQGWGPQRHANGEQTARAIAMLPILTGNIGIHGGNTGAREDSYAITMEYFPTLDNPVKTQISVFTWPDAIDRGAEMTATKDGVRGKDKLDVPIKFLWCYASNTLINQNSDINRTHHILQDESKCEFILGIDIFMTASAKYYDILLPDLMSAEQEDFVPNEGGGDMGYLIFGQPATAPKFERRRIYDTLTQIAKRLGPDVEQRFTEGRTQSQWLEYLYEKMRTEDSDLPPYEEMKKRGIFKKKNPGESLVAFKAFRKNPEKNPLKTPSGKIEIYSQKLADIAQTWQLEQDEIVTPIPVYAPTREAFNAPLSKKYPLQLSGFHYKARVHSSYANIDVLQAACIQQVWINPIDAKERGINDGDQVRVFNDRGETRLPAKVTPRIMPGVTAMGQGAWYQGNPFESKVDHGGCINILTSSHPSPLSKGNPQHTNLVEIEKI